MTRAHCLRYAVNAWTLGTDYSYVIRLHDSNRLIGSISCLNDAGKVQFGYILNPRILESRLCHWGDQAAQWQSSVGCQTLHRIWTFIDADNQASARVLLKCGLVEEARLAKWFRFVNQGMNRRIVCGVEVLGLTPITCMKCLWFNLPSLGRGWWTILKLKRHTQFNFPLFWRGAGIGKDSKRTWGEAREATSFFQPTFGKFPLPYYTCRKNRNSFMGRGDKNRKKG